MSAVNQLAPRHVKSVTYCFVGVPKYSIVSSVL